MRIKRNKRGGLLTRERPKLTGGARWLDDMEAEQMKTRAEFDKLGPEERRAKAKQNVEELCGPAKEKEE